MSKEHGRTRSKAFSSLTNISAIGETDPESKLESLVMFSSVNGMSLILLDALTDDPITFEVTNTFPDAP